jgi:esterase
MLAHTLVTAPGATPREWIVFAHGILGQGNNWRSFARGLVERDARWGAVLVDLRKHGDSQEASPPHGIVPAARDLLEVASVLPSPVTAVLGHSFGGKVALALASLRALPLEHLLVVDSNPGPTDPTNASADTHRVLAALAQLPESFDDRAAAIAALTAATARPPAFVQWLAMLYVRTGEGDRVRRRLDLAAIEAMMADYHTQDFWSVVDPPDAGLVVSFLLGGASDRLGPHERARLDAAAAAHPDRLKIESVAGAGHFVHVDAPAATSAWIARSLGVGA